MERCAIVTRTPADAATADGFIDRCPVLPCVNPDGEMRHLNPNLHVLVGDRIYFGCRVMSSVHRWLHKDPRVVFYAPAGNTSLRYAGRAVFVEDEEVMRLLMDRYWTVDPELSADIEAFYLEDLECWTTDEDELGKDIDRFVSEWYAD